MIRNLLLLVCLCAWLPAAAHPYTVEQIENVQSADRTRFTSNPDGILSQAAVARIDSICYGLRQRGAAQVAVVAVDAIAGGDPFTFAYELFSKWGVGRREDSNGVGILLVREQREIRFVTGRGVEGVLPDALCKRIQTNYMLPAFREGDYDRGMVRGVEAVAAVLAGSELETGVPDAVPQEDDTPWWVIALIVGGCVAVPLVAVVRMLRCPRCKRWFALRSQGERIVLRAEGWRMVEQTLVCRRCGETIRRRRREADGELTIVDETAQLNFEGDPSAYIPYSKTKIPMRTSFENTYEYAPLSKFRTQTVAFMPVLVDLGERGYVLYTESDVEAYPGVYLTYDKEARGFAARFAEYPTETSLTKRFQDVVERSADYIARVDGRRSYPWRIVAYAATVTELPVNDMVWQTAEASRVADASWVRDGKIAWDWWNNWGVYGVDFKSGINTETYKYFIDFAAANGIEYVALDEGWGVRDGDVMHVVPEIDLPEIVSYARGKKVGIILWVVAKVLDDKLEEACRYYSELGVAGWKVDFIDRQDQAAVERVYRIADAAARYRMIVDFHGVYKPTGLQRTYPNVVNFEGIFGLEQLKWTDKTAADMPAYDCTFPFIRQVAGPVDYTQGAMRNASRKNFRAVNNHPMSQGTRAHQVATYVVFDSPLVMLCDSPTAYEKEPETLDYIVRFPTRFDQTLIPAGEIGRYIVTARRAGDRWYLGALTNWDAREVEVKLDFLGDGRWKARIFRDGVNADRYGEDYLLEERTVTAADSLAMPMAPGGGYAVQFERVQ